MKDLVLETERLYLRKFSPKEDAPFFVELVNSPSWLKYIGDRNIHTNEEAAAYISERVMKGYAEHGYGGYVVILKSTGETVGNCGLFKRTVLDFPDIGFSFLPEYEGKGYGFEAASAVLEMARKLKLQRVFGITVEYNYRSIGLLEKLGLRLEKKFRMEGDPEELCLYSIDLQNE